MRHPSPASPAPPRRRRSAALGLLVAAVAPGAAASQEPTPPDSATMVAEAREEQQRFERFRQSRIPVEREPVGGGCDRRIGRICIWFGGAGEALYPPEPVQTGEARRRLISVLLRTRHEIADPWVVGQVVHYMVEAGEYDQAEQVAEFCGIARWWCAALLGYSLHVRGHVEAAEEAFRESLAAMPAAERIRWTTPRYVLTAEGRAAFEGLGPGARDSLWTTFWRLSDPLFLVPGNDRLTDHYARLVEARNRSDAEHPQGLPWEEDLEETLIRYGRIVGWSRTQSPTFMRPGARRLPPDTRRVLGHHHPMSRGYLFPEAFLEAPADIPPESWITAPRESRTWYAPPYAPDLRGLETQVGRFRRGESMLVVGAYRPAPTAGADGGAGAETPAASDAGGGTGRGEARSGSAGSEAAVEAGLFLVPVDGGPARVTRAAVPPGPAASGGVVPGVLTVRSPPGRWVSSLEVLDREGRRAWRARQGVRQEPLQPGRVDVSDLMILAEGAPFPESLDDAIPHVRPGIRLRRGERFTVVWEVYGLEVRESIQVTLGFTRGRPGFLARVGEFLGIIEPDIPVEVAFAEAAPDEVETVFRALVLEFPDVGPGEYTVHLRLERAGHDPVVASRPVVVE